MLGDDVISQSFLQIRECVNMVKMLHVDLLDLNV